MLSIHLLKNYQCNNIKPDTSLLVYGCDIKHIYTGLVALSHCITPRIKSLCIERHEKNHTLGITIKVRRHYILFIMSKFISVQDGDMLVGVLNKNYAQKMHKVLLRKERMFATRFSTSGVAFLRTTVRSQVFDTFLTSSLT